MMTIIVHSALAGLRDAQHKRKVPRGEPDHLLHEDGALRQLPVEQLDAVEQLVVQLLDPVDRLQLVVSLSR